MPTYAYECQSCGHKFEKFQSMTAKVLRTCPECSESTLARLIGTGAAIIFKGSGFYSTDYGRSGRKAAGSKDGDSGSGSSESSSSGESSTPAKAADTKPKPASSGD
jgi:putative FmdB family regulatory protein